MFRIDHDQAYEQTMNLRYQLPHTGPWIDFTWRFDSGEVAGSVPDLASALALTADEQAAIAIRALEGAMELEKSQGGELVIA